jgi:hypothetical protein
MLKSYNIFVDSDRGRTLNLYEQAPSGGVVRVSLKSLSVARSFSNMTVSQRGSIRMAVAPVGSSFFQVAANVDNALLLPAAIYLTREHVVNAIYDMAEAVVKAYDPAAVVTRNQQSGIDFENSTISADGKALYVLFFDIPDPIIDTGYYPLLGTIRHISTDDPFANGFYINPDYINMAVIPSHVYLRTDAAPGHNLESPSLAGQAGSSPYTDMHHSDILGSVALTRGENPFTWRAYIKDERCFDA